MNKPLLVGITGGIGSGKSTASKVFEILGIPVYYADDRGKILLVTSEELMANVKSEFGKESYSNGELNRQYLAERVFSNEEELAKLNSFVHPAVAKDFEEWVSDNPNHRYLLKEAALHFEIGSYQSLDKNICVMASKKTRMERVLLRDPQRSADQVAQIMDKQTSDGVRKKLADFLIDNEGNKHIVPQIISIHKTLLELAG